MKIKKLLNGSITLITLSLLVSGCSKSNTTPIHILNEEPDETNNAMFTKALSGGSSTVFDTSDEAFGHASSKLSFEDKTKFMVGDSLFDQNWLVSPSSTKNRDGLGPFFNAVSCASCHFRDGRGNHPKEGEKIESLLLRISLPGKNPHNGPLPSHIYGDQLQGGAINGTECEADVNITYQQIKGEFSDGETYILKNPVYKITGGNYGELEKNLMISPRVGNQMIGLGLLEDISENDLLKLSDPDDKNNDGISGKPNYVWDVENNKQSLGRFGWKANQPSLRQQVAGAFSGDIGITSSIFPNENYSDLEYEKLKVSNILKEDTPELDEKSLERVTLYSRSLAVPARRDINDSEVFKGEKLFSELSCNTCHVTEIKSKDEVIHPYTDLLLHDMGENLADHRPDYLANGNEWRTAPLWGIGLFKTVNGHTNYMHDGRANNLTEAILWHGGEADKSKDKFKNLTKNQRDAMIKFLNSL